MIINEVESEIKLWEDLDYYVNKNMKGKTLIKPIKGEIESMLKERKQFLRNLIRGEKDEDKNED